MTTVLITGGTGLVGRHLTGMLLNQGYRVIVLSRTARTSDNPHLTYMVWDVEKQTIDPTAVQQADHIVHLAGAGVADKRWSKERKREIADSRTQSAALIVRALEEYPNKVQSVISASAIGWYGSDTRASRQDGFKEDAPADHHFLGETCRRWEESITPVTQHNKRLVKLRIGIVLSEEGGALKEFMKPLRFGFATIMGSGEQVISWLHIDDLCRIIMYAIEQPSMHGVYNAVAPQPVTNRQLVLTLAKKMRGKAFIPVHIPRFALRLALGEMSIEILKSATVSSDKLHQSGFVFLYPTITAALHLK